MPSFNVNVYVSLSSDNSQSAKYGTYSPEASTVTSGSNIRLHTYESYVLEEINGLKLPSIPDKPYFRIFEDDVDEPEVDEPPPHPASDSAKVARKADL